MGRVAKRGSQELLAGSARRFYEGMIEQVAEARADGTRRVDLEEYLKRVAFYADPPLDLAEVHNLVATILEQSYDATILADDGGVISFRSDVHKTDGGVSLLDDVMQILGKAAPRGKRPTQKQGESEGARWEAYLAEHGEIDLDGLDEVCETDAQMQAALRANVAALMAREGFNPRYIGVTWSLGAAEATGQTEGRGDLAFYFEDRSTGTASFGISGITETEPQESFTLQSIGVVPFT